MTMISWTDGLGLRLPYLETFLGGDLPGLYSTVLLVIDTSLHDPRPSSELCYP